MTGPLETRSEGLVAVLLEGVEYRPFWADIADRVQEVLDNSDNEWTLSHLSATLEAKEMALWTLFDEKSKIVAFMFVQPLESSKGWYMDLPFTWSSSFCAGTTLWLLVEDWAREIGYYGLKFVSSNEKLASWAKRRGMRRRFIEYVKEF